MFFEAFNVFNIHAFFIFINNYFYKVKLYVSINVIILFKNTEKFAII